MKTERAFSGEISGLTALQGIPEFGVDEAFRLAGGRIHGRIDLFILARFGVAIIEHNYAGIQMTEPFECFRNLAAVFIGELNEGHRTLPR